jgi:hypothetical protein
MITNEAAADLAQEALKFLHRETACGLVGLIFSDAAIAITGIIPPSVMDIVRNVTTTQFGGENLAAAAEWLQVNYNLIHKEADKPKFAFLWKGHSHHQLNYDHFSSTDEDSILEAVNLGLDVAIGALTLIDRNDMVVYPGLQNGTIYVTAGASVRLRFYYLSRAMVDAGIKKPILLTPRIISAKSVPALPSLPWEFTNEAAFRRQIRQLEDYGAHIVVLHRDVSGDPTQEVQFVVQKPSWRGTLMITTSWDYPNTPPLIQVISDTDPSKPGMEINEAKLDKDGHSLWTPETDFIDIVLKIVEKGDL